MHAVAANKRHQVQIVRHTLAQVYSEANISPSGRLSVQDQPVALIYFWAYRLPQQCRMGNQVGLLCIHHLIHM